MGCRVEPTIDPAIDPAPQPKPVVEESEPGDSPVLPIAFGYVTPGGERETGLPQMIDKGGLAWIAGVSAFEDFAPELAEALERSGIGLSDEPASSDAIDPRMVVAAGFGPPAPTIWLVDDEGVCEARIATPHVGMYFDVGPTVEISWRLEGCDPSRAWGPIGLFTVAPPERLRWLETGVTSSEAVDPASYSGRAAGLLREFAEGFEDPPDEYWLRETPIVDTDIAQVQLAGLWRHRPGPGEEYDDCQESAYVVGPTGHWRESGFEPYAMGLDDSPWLDGAELVGAFVIDGEARWLVFSARMQALVITPGEQPQEIITGIHHDEVVAFTSWSPAASCEP